MKDNYDSNFERSIISKMETLGFIRCDDYFPLTFKDETGQTFNAKADWYHPALELYAETKSHTLNSKTTVQTAQNAEQRQQQYRRSRREKFSTLDQLNTQWAHSRYKQAAVQRSLSPQRMIVVFEKPIPYDAMKAYSKAGLVAIDLRSLRSYLAYIHFGRKGLFLQFSYEYYDRDISFVL